MNEELSNALAELAKGLGTSTGELWAWLQGDGLAAYARVQVARLTVHTILWAVISGIAIAVCVALYMGIRKTDDEEMVGVLLIVGLFVVIGLIISLAFLTAYASDLACWMASPEGMVIQKVLEVMG